MYMKIVAVSIGLKFGWTPLWRMLPTQITDSMQGHGSF
jgi:hypothetical protein